MAKPHVLVLGGTGEARLLTERLSGRQDLHVTLSLAGRTKSPLPQAGETRVGGYGGAEGLAVWLREHAVDVLVDATHPYAARISGNAEVAARRVGVPLVVLERPEWQSMPGDRWTFARDTLQAAALIGEQPKTVFLSIGRQELAPFRTHPQHAYIVRSVEAVGADQLLANARYVLARGPFSEEDERTLLTENGVQIVVAKNSGGAATYGKIAAARNLGLPVVMIERPRRPAPDAVHSIDEALARIVHCAGLSADRGE